MKKTSDLSLLLYLAFFPLGGASNDLALHLAGQHDDGQKGQDNQGQLPPVHKGDDQRAHDGRHRFRNRADLGARGLTDTPNITVYV